jgi:hypothetical protein
MQSHNVLSVLFLSVLVFTSGSIVPVTAEQQWDIQVVSKDATYIGSGYCPINVDSEGNPHIAYSGSPDLGYMSWTGSEWNNQKLQTTAFAYDFELDANDTPHIILGSLDYATWNGTQWDFQTISTDYTVYSSLALDSLGNPHVAYVSGDELKYATQNGSNWVTYTVTTGNLSGIAYRLSLALDSNDTPHIMYYSDVSFVDEKGNTIQSINLNLAVLQNSSWVIEPVLASLKLVAFGNMVLDSAGNPHFLAGQYFYPEGSDTPIRTIEYVRWDGSAWKTQTVTSNVTIHHLGLLALDSEDRPHIIYITKYPQQLMYARWTGTEWKTYHVDWYGTVPICGFNFDLDAMGNPHISYINMPEKNPIKPYNLMYATATLPQLPPLEPLLNITITSPENKTYSTTEVPLTFTANKNVSSTYYNVDGEANVTISGNTTLTNLTNGTHSLTIYAEDTNQNNLVSETVYFTVAKEDDLLQTFLDSPFLLGSTAIIIGVVIVAVYFWNRKK